MITQSQNIALQLYFSDYQNDARVLALWNKLRESAVEAMEAPIPYLSIFGEECLFCAIVMKKNPNITQSSDKQVMARNIVDEVGDSSIDPTQGPHDDEPIGIVYVTAAPAQSVAGEANVGIVMASSYQRKGYAREAVELVLRWVFDELKFHRVQAAIMETPQKDRVMRVFIGQGFTHEGTRRRSVFKKESEDVGGGVWKDVTYLAMLDTEWALRDILHKSGPAPTLWDEMFVRHTREREDMVKWDEKHNRVRRMSSTETLRNGEAPLKANSAIDAWPSDFESSSSRQSSCYGSVPPSPLHGTGVAAISNDMLEYLEFAEEDTDAVSRQSSPSPYSFSFPSPNPIPSRSPSVSSSVSTFDSDDSDDESGVPPRWRVLHGIPNSGASSSSSGRLSWAGHPLIISRSGSVSGGSESESESWSDATDGPDASGSDWDMMSEPERVHSN
ncbi:hypothetical protein K503DRAFT_768487 [Rhizopogon vinicolor AM-OR11-026]|uniref:N-acetyltransferase domain-containing protein n=1 Tax=Rhizopogon vinicolor AM-OR11-026 TaxID=1314800 RepID=A0A1B7N6U0_9AGAM|nr:hypothetical protein K503DRAFT_768487 [Rhizopogon vinicolor AM-OR11-026]